MTNLELKTKMVALVDEGMEPTNAFYACCKAGMEGVKRPVFEEEYVQLVASPLLRRMALRNAREEDFKLRLSELCMQADPGASLHGEKQAVTVAHSLSRARNNPGSVPECFAMFRDYFTTDEMKERYAKLQGDFALLWPEFTPEGNH